MAPQWITLADVGRREVDPIIYDLLADLTAKGWRLRRQGHKFYVFCPCGDPGGKIRIDGTPRNPTGAKAIPTLRWAFDQWGELAMMAVTGAGPIYTLEPGADTEPVVMSANAPTDCKDFIVTDQRIVMVIAPGGATGEDRLVQWSDSEDYDTWAPDTTNQAGSQILPGTGALVSIHMVLGQILVLTEGDAHAGRYLGPPYIYGFERVGKGCGPIGPHVTVKTDNFAMWLGDRQFWMFDGTARPVPCDVMDFLSTDVDGRWASAITAHPVAEFNEVWWHYKSVNDEDVRSYVAYNYLQQHWTVGILDRTAAIDQVPTVTPIYVDRNGLVWNHELFGVEAPGSYAVTGPLEIGDGEVNMAVQRIYPDTQTKGGVIYTLYGRQMPTAPERTYGPYLSANPTMTRALGREIRMRVEGAQPRWECGPVTRFEVADAGTGAR